jgi:hypothetical protein
VPSTADVGLAFPGSKVLEHEPDGAFEIAYIPTTDPELFPWSKAAPIRVAATSHSVAHPG